MRVLGTRGRHGRPPPGSGSHPGGTVCILILPDVILIIIKGLDMITTAGLEESSTGLQRKRVHYF